MVPAASRWISRVPRYSGAVSARFPPSPTGLSPAAAPLSRGFGWLPAVPLSTVLQPRQAHCYAGGLGSGAFARHYSRYHCCFLFLRVLGCFGSPGSLLPPADGAVARAGLPHSEIRGSSRVFAPDRGLSQLVTSFFASESPGILHVPLLPFLFSLTSGWKSIFCRCQALRPAAALDSMNS